jgi:hypothetical protein
MTPHSGDLVVQRKGQAFREGSDRPPLPATDLSDLLSDSLVAKSETLSRSTSPSTQRERSITADWVSGLLWLRNRPSGSLLSTLMTRMTISPGPGVTRVTA